MDNEKAGAGEVPAKMQTMKLHDASSITCSGTGCKVDALLSRLDGVRQTGHGRWIALCPAHEDHSPSLSVREMPDGRILLHDFAGCDTEEVLAAVGLTFTDLYPECRLGDRLPRVRHPYNPLDILRCCTDEVLISAISATLVAHGMVLDDAERRRMFEAAGRLAAAMEIAHA
jgi:hypothetical protein